MSKLKSTWPFQALSDENRFRAVRLLAKEHAPLTAGQIAIALNMQPNHLSRHLHILEVAGLTTIERRGRNHFVYLRDADGANAPLFSAVLSRRDDQAVLGEDMARLQRELGGLSEP